MTSSEPAPALRASIVIPTYNNRAQIGACLDAVLQQDLPPDQFEIIVVDNASTDGGLAWVRATYPQVRTLALEANYGFAGGNNRAARAARGAWIAFLNADTEAEPDWLRQLLAVAEGDARVGAVHAAQLFPWSRGPAGQRLLTLDLCPWGFVRYYPVRRGDAPRATLSTAGSTVMIRRAWLEHGNDAFDESYFMYGEDRDLGLRLNGQGYAVLAVPAAVIRHHQSNLLDNTAKAGRIVRLVARNGWHSYLKNMSLSEFLLLAPVVCLGSLLKPWEFPGPLPRRLAAGLGLFALTLAYLPAALWHYARHPEARRQTLARRRRPWGWMLSRLLRLRGLSDADAAR